VSCVTTRRRPAGLGRELGVMRHHQRRSLGQHARRKRCTGAQNVAVGLHREQGSEDTSIRAPERTSIALLRSRCSPLLSKASRGERGQ